MRTAACLLLIVSLVGVPAGALLARSAVPAGGSHSVVAHQSQPPVVRAETSPRLVFQRYCTLRADDGALTAGGFAVLGADRAHQSSAFAQSQRPSFVLRI
jgi:hypothetical protein